MNIVPVQSTLIAGAYRRQGWRATLRSDGFTVWRCECVRPHFTVEAADACGLTELRARLGRRGMRVWTATYRATSQFTPAEIEQMDEARALVALDLQTNPNLPDIWNDNLPTKHAEVKQAIANYEAAIFAARNSEEVNHYKRTLRQIREKFIEHQDLRQQCEIAFMCAEWVLGGWLVAEEDNEATGTRGQLAGSTASGALIVKAPEERLPTVIEKTGNRGSAYPWRLKELADISIEQLRDYGATLHRKGREATLHGIVDLKRTDESRARRAASLYAEPFPEGMEYRIGDCRTAFDDIEDETVAAIITDPPYTTEAEPLIEWLGTFAARVLVPGGSLICYHGGGRLIDVGMILKRHLTYWWCPIMLHGHAQKLLHAGVRANHKPILWYVKNGFRRPVHGRKTIIPDVLNHQSDNDEGRALSTRDKSDHLWSQGDAGVRVWVHHLAAPGERDGDQWVREPEIILDPFAGRGEWGRIAAGMGRRWIGCDVAAGGKEEVVVDELDDVAD